MNTWDYLLEPDELTADRKGRVVGAVTHPVAATLGALAAGGATGAVVGTTAGPVGTAVGAVLGALAGALGGDAVASSIVEVIGAARSRKSRKARTDLVLRVTFQDYAGAHAFGAGVRSRYPGAHFVRLDSQLADDWARTHGESRLTWTQARPAAREAWERR
jgi:hypothetical protein